ncbi:MAG: hypothetical protein ACRCXT_13750 [Paraclostridium sp.]
MKIVNPFGKTVNKSGDVSADPRGCMCSSGSNTVRQNAGSCFVCGCHCANGETNFQNNRSAANSKLAY